MGNIRRLHHDLEVQVRLEDGALCRGERLVLQLTLKVTIELSDVRINQRFDLSGSQTAVVLVIVKGTERYS